MIELHGVVNCYQVHEILVETDDGQSPVANASFACRFAGIAAIVTAADRIAIVSVAVHFAIVTAAADCFPTLVACCRMGLFGQEKTAVMNDVCIWDPWVVSGTRTGLRNDVSMTPVLYFCLNLSYGLYSGGEKIGFSELPRYF